MSVAWLVGGTAVCVSMHVATAAAPQVQCAASWQQVPASLHKRGISLFGPSFLVDGDVAA